MKTRNLLTGLILAVSTNAWAEAPPLSERDAIYDKLSSLIVTPYRIDTHSFNKRIYYGASSREACNYRDNGYINFVDLEGGGINNIDLSFDLPSQRDMLEKSNAETRALIGKAAKEAKAQCFDVILAPVIDYGRTERELYQATDAQTEKATERLKAISDTYASEDLISAFKHYPVGEWTPPVDEYQAQFGKTLKSPDALHNGYVEAAPVTLTDDEWFSDFDDVIKLSSQVIEQSDQSKSMIMLSNYAVKEYGYKPYIYTDAPKDDELLNNFKGLVITDDLYQLIVDKDNSLQAFKNADLFIITSYQDLKSFMNFVTNEALVNPEYYELLLNKHEKVGNFFSN